MAQPMEIEYKNEDYEIVTEGKGSIIFGKHNQVFYNKVQEFNRDMSICVIGRFVEIHKQELATKKLKFQAKLNRIKYGTSDPHPAVLRNEYTPAQTVRYNSANTHPAVLTVNKRPLSYNNHPASLHSAKYHDLPRSSFSTAVAHPSSLPTNSNADEKFQFKGVRILEALSATGLRSMRYAKELDDLRELVVNDLSAPAVEAIERNIDFNQLDRKVVKPSLGDANMVMYKSVHGEKYDVIDLDPYGKMHVFLNVFIDVI